MKPFHIVFFAIACITTNLLVFSRLPFTVEASYNFSMTEATPANSTGGSFESLISCIKDSSETNAYCSCGANYIVKLTLDPIAFAAELAIAGRGYSVALYEGGDSPRLFYTSDGTVKFVNASTFSSPTSVDSTGYYYITDSARMVSDSTYKVIYLTNTDDYDGIVYKITNLDSSSPFINSSSAISLEQASATDLILANEDLYVAHVFDPGHVARVPNVSSSTSPINSKTIPLGQSMSYYPSLFTAHDFLYVVTNSKGKIVKLSIGSTDADFALVDTSDVASTSSVDTYSFLLTPDAHHLLLLCWSSSTIYFFDLETFEYKSSMEVESKPSGGVLTSSGKLAFRSGSALYHFNFEIPTTGSPSSVIVSSSLSTSGKLGIGLGIGVGVPVVVAASVVIVVLAKAAVGKVAAVNVAANAASTNAPPEPTSNNNDKEMNVV